ncbi:ATP-binding cassette domain-containing protein [Paenibacillus sp. 5J-6]|uniref:ATP-binding cassette domain-containing protein n=1 Tax=Paenibacillus silvestris TaxID=2606219 RepID=A0A6L8V8Q0_9BACL|nr:ATP-binding cassette domain-containing protein [Paenibacillus silvestris]
MVLEGKSLGYRYGKEAWVFRNLDIHLEAGEIVGLIGPSGCGKSTLGQLLAGHVGLQEGRVSVDGVPHGQGKGLRNPVQLVLQHPEQAVNPRWKLRKTLQESGVIDPSMQSELSIEDDWLDRYPNELSGGELQRICVARALGEQTRYLIADEMTTMLDAITQAQIWRAVLSFAERQRAGVLVISHEQELIKRLCDRVISF